MQVEHGGSEVLEVQAAVTHPQVDIVAGEVDFGRVYRCPHPQVSSGVLRVLRFHQGYLGTLSPPGFLPGYLPEVQPVLYFLCSACHQCNQQVQHHTAAYADKVRIQH
jgi:hypothetical protein